LLEPSVPSFVTGFVVILLQCSKNPLPVHFKAEKDTVTFGGSRMGGEMA
jgi:hypothetical protein